MSKTKKPTPREIERLQGLPKAERDRRLDSYRIPDATKEILSRALDDQERREVEHVKRIQDQFRQQSQR